MKIIESISYRVGGAVLKIIVSRSNRMREFRNRLAPLEGRSFAFRIFGHDLPYGFRVEQGALKGPSSGCPDPDFVLESSWKVLWQISRGKLDPDAAFFRRKLNIRGSLQSALIFKNIYDGML